MEDKVLISSPQKSQNNLLWFIGPSVLVASFIFPSLYMRRILSAVFEDSLLTGEPTFFVGLEVSFSPPLLGGGVINLVR